MEAWYLQCLVLWVRKHGTAPTLLQLATWTKKSISAVRGALVSLEYKGHVARDSCRHFIPAKAGKR